MLTEARVATRLPCRDLERARRWYADKLGLEPSEERPIVPGVGAAELIREPVLGERDRVAGPGVVAHHDDGWKANRSVGPRTCGEAREEHRELRDERPLHASTSRNRSSLTGIDQRGFPRRSGAHVDIGAFEFGVPTPARLRRLGNGAFQFDLANYYVDEDGGARGI